ncbi:MAG: hypothetical protein HY735_15955 [Verrucomicrobia bacterium]|nr:hypothetical protein [Verrucomicrobiota bacterium]
MIAQTEWLDKIDESLSIQSPKGWFRSDLSGLIDLELYYIDQRPPGLIFSDDDAFINPRLSLFLDTRLGPHLYSLVQARYDRGFDPGSREDGDLRLDEYLVRYTPFEDSRLNLQFGKFATVVGNWVPRHDSWNNPFINAPLPYENVLIVTDHAAPAGPAAFLARRNLSDNKRAWVPVLWGPSYASGGSVFGRIDKYEYAVEVKNVALSARPYAWDATRHPWESPVVSGRLGFRPNATWNFGASFSQGPYLLPPDEALFPGGPIKDEFKQTTIGHDIGFAWRHWQVWGEIFVSRFDVPNVGDADTLAYYLETRYKLGPHVFVAGRWNQQLFDKVADGTGGRQRWDRDMWRIEGAVGYRLDRHVQAKVQYSFSHQNGPLQQGEQLVAGQITVKF